MAKRCSELTLALQKEKEHGLQIAGVSSRFDEKLSQMSQLLTDFLALQNYMMKQVDQIEEFSTGIKSTKDSITNSSKEFVKVGEGIDKNSK